MYQDGGLPVQQAQPLPCQMTTARTCTTPPLPPTAP